jgi:hypothetical protein
MFKSFLYVSAAPDKKASVFVADKPLQPSLMFCSNVKLKVLHSTLNLIFQVTYGLAQLACVLLHSAGKAFRELYSLLGPFSKS